MPAPAEVQAETLSKFLDGWKTITAESWTSLWSDNCTQQFLPFALGMPPKNKDEILQSLPALLSVLRNWEIDVHNVVHDAAHNRAAVYALSTADTAFDFKWNNDYALFVTFSEDGTQIDKIEEMVDTAFYREFFPRFQAHLAQHGPTP